MTVASDMVAAIESALAKNVAIVSVTFDGITTQYDRRQALEELKFWRREVAKEQGTRPRVSSINLS